MSVQAQWIASLDLSGEALSPSRSGPWLDGNASLAWKDSLWRISGGWREVRRFDLRDAEAVAQISRKWRDWTWSLDASSGSTEVFLPTRSFKLGVFLPLSRSWFLGLDGKFAQYASLTVTSPSLLLETYHGAWHAGAGLSETFASGDRRSTAWRALVDRSWSDRSAAGVQGGQSTDFERVGERIMETRVTTLGLFCRQELSSGLLGRVNLGWTRQGEVHDRWGGGVGLEYSFGR
jgi:YaiO family outer membrane protein